jgi:hypothetical protein
VRSEDKNIFFYLEKRSSLQQRRRCSYKFRGLMIGSWIRHVRHVFCIFYQLYLIARRFLFNQLARNLE